MVTRIEYFERPGADVTYYLGAMAGWAPRHLAATDCSASHTPTRTDGSPWSLQIQSFGGVEAKQPRAPRTSAWHTGIARMPSQRRTQLAASLQFSPLERAQMAAQSPGFSAGPLLSVVAGDAALAGDAEAASGIDPVGPLGAGAASEVAAP